MRIGLLALAAVAVASGCGGDSGELPNAFVAVRSQDNPVIPATDTFTEVVRLALEPGQYQVTGKVELQNADAAAAFNTQCGLVPGTPDGTAADPDTPGSDARFLHLQPSGGAGESGGIVLFVSQELSEPASVVLGCSGYGNEHGAFAAYASIRAIQVGSITQDSQP